MKARARLTLVTAIAVLCFAPVHAGKRSAKAVQEFKSVHKCPANGGTGKCPGYVIDHIVPLACGGADHPSNMQWQTVAEGKAKDKWERKQCRQRGTLPERFPHRVESHGEAK